MNDSSQHKPQFRISKEKQALIQKLLRERGIGRPTTPLPITRSGQTEGLPLSFAQERLWFLDQLMPGSAVYNIPTLVRLRGPLVPEALDHGLSRIVERHTALRTVFTERRGRPTATVLAPSPVTTPVIDLTALPEPTRERSALEQANEQAASIFELPHGPLIRTMLWRLAPDDHFFAIFTHHIISEAWSIAILFDELEMLYAEYITGTPPQPLPELPVDYADYARWERALSEREDHKEHIEYWVQQLADLPGPLLLASDHPRPSIPTQQGAITRRPIPAELCRRLTALSHQENATLFMVLLAAYDVLLHRYTGHQDVLVGSPISSRSRIEVEKLIGFFVGTIVLRSRVTGDLTLRQLLQQVRETTLEAFSHQDVAFERIVSRIQPPRELSHHPVFQVMFALQNTPRPKLHLTNMEPAIVLGEDSIHSRTTKTDLALLVEQDDDELTAWVEYASDLFEPDTIERFLGHYERILEAMVSNINERVGSISLLSTAERHQLLVEWNDTRADYTQRCVHEFVEAQVRLTPQAVAVVCGENALTYEALNQRANQLAHYLQGLGVGPEVLVGICAERSTEMLIALLGVLKAGGAYLPLDPTYPTQRLAFMLEDSGVKILLTQQHLQAELPSTGSQLICLDSDWEDIARAPDADPSSGATMDNAAYVIYTSGSTGTPKGTVILHRGLTNYLSWCVKAYDVAAGRGAPVHSSIAFDLTITGLFPPLLVGRTVHMLPDADNAVEALSGVLRDGGDYSLVKLTPVHLELLRRELAPGEMAGRTRTFVIGGENLVGESLEAWLEHAGETVLVNEYGPTETVVGCCVYVVPGGSRPRGSVPIGRPIANTQLYILDAHMEPTPVGVTGELYIGGDGVARGYLNRPELTQERFVQNPFNDDPAARMYRTGDLARYRPDGNIEFLGRVDHQVKIRGFRIELGEIEVALMAHSAVREAVVIVRGAHHSDANLVAYIVVEALEHVTASEVRRYLRRRLPEYMVPGLVVQLEALPLTSNGKVDRRALPDPFDDPARTGREFEAPASESERLVAEIWQHLLPVERVGRRDNFYELGGHSLLSIQAIAAIAERTGVRLNPRILFFQDVAQIATVLAGEHAGA